MNDRQMLWVPKSFHRRVKMEAARKGMTVMQFLRNLSSQGESIDSYFKKIDKKKSKGGFKFEF